MWGEEEHRGRFLCDGEISLSGRREMPLAEKQRARKRMKLINSEGIDGDGGDGGRQRRNFFCHSHHA
jgi:hypothetical protein